MTEQELNNRKQLLKELRKEIFDRLDEKLIMLASYISPELKMETKMIFETYRKLDFIITHLKNRKSEYEEVREKRRRLPSKEGTERSPIMNNETREFMTNIDSRMASLEDYFRELISASKPLPEHLDPFRKLIGKTKAERLFNEYGVSTIDEARELGMTRLLSCKGIGKVAMSKIMSGKLPDTAAQSSHILNDPRDLSTLLRIPEAAALLGYEHTTLYHLCHRKKIPFIRCRGNLFFEKEALLQWLENQTERVAYES